MYIPPQHYSGSGGPPLEPAGVTPLLKSLGLGMVLTLFGAFAPAITGDDMTLTILVIEATVQLALTAFCVRYVLIAWEKTRDGRVFLPLVFVLIGDGAACLMLPTAMSHASAAREAESALSDEEGQCEMVELRAMSVDPSTDSPEWRAQATECARYRAGGSQPGSMPASATSP